MALTPMQEKGYKVGDIFLVTDSEHNRFGKTLKFIQDDGTSFPYFLDMTTGRRCCNRMASITKVDNVYSVHDNEPKPVKTGSPAEMRGIKEGDRVRLIGKRGSTIKVDTFCSIGDIFILERDDYSDNPYFRKEGEESAGVFCPHLVNLEKVEESETKGETKMANRGEATLVQVTDYLDNGLEVGDVIITKDGEKKTSDNSCSGPDLDNEFSTTGGYVDADDILEVHRISYKPNKVNVSVTLSRKDAEALARSGHAFFAFEVESHYTPEFREAVASAIQSLANELDDELTF